MQYIIAILIFGIIIIVHEFGHFLLAKKNGIGVVEFSVGMGPRLFSFDKGGTKYSLKLLPIGGSCMMVGEDEDNSATDAFNNANVWRRISVIFAGPFFNFILAFVFALIVVGFTGYDKAYITSVDESISNTENALQVGDIITNINGKSIYLGREVDRYLMYSPIGIDGLNITYKRNGEKYKTTIYPEKVEKFQLGITYSPSEGTPAQVEITGGGAKEAGMETGDIIVGINGNEISDGLALSSYLSQNSLTSEVIVIDYERNGVKNTVNVYPKSIGYRYNTGFSYNLYRENTDFLGMIKYSFIEVKYWIDTTLVSLKQLILGKVSANDLSGPVGVISVIGDTYETSKKVSISYALLNMAYLSILLSANIGVMNLLPIPALDGGRLVFLIIEAFRGKPIDREKEGYVHGIGLILLLVLMAFIMFNDVRKLL